MKREELEALGLTKEQIDPIMALNGRDIEKHKTAAETVKAELDAAKAQLVEANTAIEGFKKLDIDGIKKAADEWKLKAETAETAAKQQVETLRFDHALEQALAGAKVKDPVSVKANLKTDLLKLAEDGNISGLGEQLGKLKTEKAFLFEDDKPAPQIIAGGQTQTTVSDPLWASMLKGAGLTEPKG
jgi:Phage minor structural protein GP20